VKLVVQWSRLESALDPSWGEAQLLLLVDDESRSERAAALLGPANPGRSGSAIRFTTARGGGALGPEAVRRMLRRLDDEEIAGRLELVATSAAAPLPVVDRRTLADAWDGELAALPSDWSDLWCELRLTSTDHLEPAALLIAPLNPLRFDDSASYRFRCARRFGYGTSPGMVHRCLERLDDEDIPGKVGVLRALSDTHPAATQGPVWYVGGRTV
jgi:hypothetical protein